VIVRITSKPMRIALGWQVIATIVLGLGAGLIWDVTAAKSALLGATINMVADLGYALMTSVGPRVTSAGNVLRKMLRAEAVRLIVLLVLMGWTLSNVKSLNHLIFLIAFGVSVLVFRMAIFVKDAT
jgi:ATP synthase protein I